MQILTCYARAPFLASNGFYYSEVIYCCRWTDAFSDNSKAWFLTRLRRLVFRLATFATCVEQSNLIRLRRRFPVARFTLFAQYRVIIKQTIHACHNQTGQSFSAINFTSEHAGCEFPCLLHRKNPPVGSQLSRSINYRHGRRDKVL